MSKCEYSKESDPEDLEEPARRAEASKVKLWKAPRGSKRLGEILLKSEAPKDTPKERVSESLQEAPKEILLKRGSKRYSERDIQCPEECLLSIRRGGWDALDFSIQFWLECVRISLFSLIHLPLIFGEKSPLSVITFICTRLKSRQRVR